eukprot:s6316_g1.t1
MMMEIIVKMSMCDIALNPMCLLPHLWHSDGGRARYFESWAFAAPRGCAALRAWRDELRRAAVQGFAAYCADITAETDAQAYLHNSLREWLPYLVIHATLARVRYQQPVLAVKTLPAESTGLAHSNYAVGWRMAFLSGLTDFALDGTGGPLLAMARGPQEVPPPPRVGPLVKLRGLERVAFDCVLYYQGYAADSPSLDRTAGAAVEPPSASTLVAAEGSALSGGTGSPVWAYRRQGLADPLLVRPKSRVLARCPRGCPSSGGGA